MKKLRWLQWSANDLASGLGGVEVHARCLDRELRALGVEARLSSDPADLRESWDVVQTHGSCAGPGLGIGLGIGARRRRHLRVHTLHGSTIGRMRACGEWLWPGGYAAYTREWSGVLQSQVTLGVHPGLHFLPAARAIGKRTAVCGNGWDSAREFLPLPPELEARLKAAGPFFCFVGRGDDRVKNTALLARILETMPQARLVAIPGSGFTSGPGVVETGRLDPVQIRTVLRMSRGLVLSSFYEGMPLVVLEALGDGIPVFSTYVGGLKHLPSGLRGVNFLDQDWGAWITALSRAVDGANEGNTDLLRFGRAELNRPLLPTWRKVAEIALDAVHAARGTARP